MYCDGATMTSVKGFVLHCPICGGVLSIRSLFGHKMADLGKSRGPTSIEMPFFVENVHWERYFGAELGKRIGKYMFECAITKNVHWERYF